MPPAFFNRRTLYLLLALNLFLNAIALYAKFRPSASPAASTLAKRSLMDGDSNELLYADHGQEQCENIHLRQNQCLFVQDNCKGMVAGLFNYLEFYYCTVETRIFGFTVMVIWLLCLFSLVGIAASDFFCPNLSTIASSLHMSENMAGVTFLAFGNGSPDLFSTFSALTADSGGLAIGELVGAASFIINVIVGSMAVISPFQVARYPFLRDITFFLGAVLFVVYTVWDGRVTMFESIFLVCYYSTYVVVIVSGSWVRTKFINRSALPEASIEETIEDISSPTVEYQQYEPEIYDEYSEQRPLLGKTPSAEAPRPMTPLNDQFAVSTPVLLLRPLRAGNDGEAVQSGFDNDSGIDEHLANRATNLAVAQSSLMFRKKIQHRRRQSMLGAFEFRDTMHSWKDILKRSDPFSITGAWSPTTPHPNYHRRAPSHDWFDTARAYPRHALRTSSYQGTPTRKTFTSFTTSPLRYNQVLPADVENTPQESAVRVNQVVASPEAKSTSSPHSTSNDSPAVRIPPLPRANLFIDTQVTEHSLQTDRLLPPPLLTPAVPDSPSTLRNHTPASNQQLVPVRQLLLPTPLPPGNIDHSTNNDITIISTDYFPDVLHTTRIEEEYANATNAESSRPSRRGSVRPLREILFPHLVDWKYKSHTSKVVGLVATPMVFLLSVTVPVVDEEPDDDVALAKAVAAVTEASGRSDRAVDNEQDAEDDDLGPVEGCGAKWNRRLTVTQFAISPVFVSMAINAADPDDSSLLGVGIAAIVGLVLSSLCWWFTTEDNIPKWHRQMCFIGFGIAIVWIYFVANEVVGLLQAFGLILGLSEAIIGLTVFAVGNSLGDFVANVTIARMGFPVMAVSACFGGPLLNILLGIGLSTTYITVRTGQDCQLSQLTPTIFMSSFVLLLSLTASLIIVPATGYCLTRRYGYFLISLYAVGMVVNITMEVVNRSKT